MARIIEMLSFFRAVAQRLDLGVAARGFFSLHHLFRSSGALYGFLALLMVLAPLSVRAEGSASGSMNPLPASRNQVTGGSNGVSRVNKPDTLQSDRLDVPARKPAGVLFIEGNVAGYAELAAAVRPSLDVVVLDAEGDGLKQMADALSGRKNIPAVHLISHGKPGMLELGSLAFDAQALKHRQSDLARIGAALGANAELLLYGCNVAEGEVGQQFLGALANITGTRIAASSNLTGAADQGGDWLLEYRTGAVHSAVLAFPTYRGLLPSVAGTVTIPFNLADNTLAAPKLTDGLAASGTVDIPGIVYEIYFANSGNIQTGQVTNVDLGGGTGSMILYYNTATSQYDPVSALIIKSQSNRLFGFARFKVQDAQGLSATYTATAYRNNVAVGPGYSFTTGGNLNPVTINLPAQFANVDEVRITSDGGTSGTGAKLWQEGFNAFAFVNPTANADLSSLAASAGTLNPVFSPQTTIYAFSVANAVTSTTVTPAVDIPGSSVTVNGAPVSSGTASGSIGLVVGGNSLTVLVTAPNGTTTKTYTIVVTRAAPLSSNADLSALALSNGTLSPAFAAGMTSYTASVAHATAFLTVTPTVSDATASVTVNGVAVTSGAPSGAIAMSTGSNAISVMVTAQDGSTKQYTLTVTRALYSANAALSALSLSSGTLSPAFASGTTTYTASVNNATTSLTVTPTVADATASVKVNGVATTSSNASGALALAVGANTINVAVTAQDGTTAITYTVTVTRAASGDANLSALVLSGGNLSPGFAPATTSYTMSVAATTGSITVTPTVSETNASVKVNGVAVTSGTASAPVSLNTGANAVAVEVTAQNGAVKTYTVTVTRAISTNKDLAALSLSTGALNPVFSAPQLTYSATVPHATTSITVTPTVADSSASVTVNGVSVVSGTASGNIGLNTGSNPITVVVTAQDGVTTNTYTVTVTRSALPTAATGTSPGGGTVTAALAGPAGCGFDRTAFIGLTGSPNSPPASPGIANYTFTQGLFDVEVGACPTSSTVTITLVYPQPFAVGSVYMKYGPTAADPAPHWYSFPGAVINGNTVTLTLTDGGAGDDDRIANGRIADPGGVALPAAGVPGGATGIPTLSQWALILLSLLLGGVAAGAGPIGFGARRKRA